jgi:hypothetical protein
MSNIVVFLQQHGSPAAEELEIALAATLAELLAASKAAGVQEDVLIFIDEHEEPLGKETCIEHSGAKHGSRVHVSHCRNVEVTLHYQEKTIIHRFPPGAKVHRVKQWAVHHFKLAETDAAEHVLQICGGTERPSGDTPLHTLLAHRSCSLCFDLVPEKRVEG